MHEQSKKNINLNNGSLRVLKEKKHSEELEKQTEAIKANKTILDLRVIKEKEEEILREKEMKQQE